MKRLLLLSLFVLLLVGCGPSFDEEGMLEVRSYAEEMIPAIDASLMYIDAWANEQDENSVLKVHEQAEEVESIKDDYWDGYAIKGYELEEIDEWMVNVSRGETSWTIDGEELADALYEVHSNSEVLAERMRIIEEDADSIDADELQRLASIMDMSRRSIDELRMILFNQ